jgi:hypothetical protein
MTPGCLEAMLYLLPPWPVDWSIDILSWATQCHSSIAHLIDTEKSSWLSYSNETCAWKLYCWGRWQSLLGTSITKYENWKLSTCGKEEEADLKGEKRGKQTQGNKMEESCWDWIFLPTCCSETPAACYVTSSANQDSIKLSSCHLQPNASLHIHLIVNGSSNW